MKTVTDTSDGKKIKFMDTSNGNLRQKLLSNRTLLVVIINMDFRIDGRIATSGGTPHTLATPATKEFIMEVACNSARFNHTPRHVRWTGRDGSNPGDTCIDLSSTRDNFPVIIGKPTVSPYCGLSEGL